MEVKYGLSVARVMVAGFAGASLLSGFVPATPTSKPPSKVLGRYPSAGELRAEITKRRSSDPAGFQAALLDLDIAIRHLHLRRASNPPDPDAGVPHIPDQPEDI